VKAEVTKHKLLEFLELLDELVTWIHLRSLRLDPLYQNHTPFLFEPTIDKKEYENAFKLVVNRESFFKEVVMGQRRMFVCANPNGKKVITQESAEAIATMWTNMSWPTFDEYAGTVIQARILLVDNNHPAQWKGVVCACVDFQKSHICICAIGLAHILGLCDIPEEHQVN
jgi:hypothetical protein